jgi:D-xylose transport system ATP-binding protein
MRNITKEFPGVKALDNVSLAVRKGEIHALCGENGAGKSTLMKVLSGVYPHKTYTGDILINDKVMTFDDIRQSEAAGVAIIYQELALVKELDVAENIFLGNMHSQAGIIKWDKLYFEAGKILEDIGIQINLNSKIKDIGIGHQQMVEIAKALAMKTDILILDEPTAALTEAEVEILMRILRKLRNDGVSCIYISHKLNEVLEIADRVTILRDGATVGTYDIEKIDEEKIISLMVGRDLEHRYPERDLEIGEVALEVKNFTVFSQEIKSKEIIKDASFNVRKGEILGIAGLMGAGRTELITSIFGFMNNEKKGTILIDGREVQINSPYDAISNGMAMVSEDRKRYGLVLLQSVAENTTLASLGKISNNGILSKDKEVHETTEFVVSLGIKTPNVDTVVNTLSGGNQQKVLLARCLMTKPKILFLDEPTRGIDVGAKFDIYTLMNQLAADGTAIIMVSSELPEVLGMSDRTIVMHEGRITGEFSRSEATSEKIMMKASKG